MRKRDKYLIVFLLISSIFKTGFIFNGASFGVILLVAKLIILLYLLIENKKIITYKLKNFKNDTYIFVFIIFLFYFVSNEIIKSSNVSDLKITIYHLVNFFIPLFVLKLIIKNDEVSNIIIFFSKTLNFILIVAVFYAFIMHLSYSEIVNLNDIYYQKLTLFGRFNLYQSVHNVYWGKSSMRVSSFFGNPNTFSFNIAIAFCINVYRIKQFDYEKKKLLIMNILLVLGFTLGKSRASLLFVITYFVCSYVLNLINLRSIGKKHIIKLNLKTIVTSIILFLIFLILAISFSNRYSLSIDRFGPWSAGLKIIKNNYVSGLGIKNFSSTILEDYGFGHAHNSIIQVVGVGGVVALLFFIYLIYRSFKVTLFNLKSFKHSPKSKFNYSIYNFNVFLFSFAFSALFYQISEVFIFTDKWTILLYLLILSFMTVQDNYSNNKENEKTNILIYARRMDPNGGVEKFIDNQTKVINKDEYNVVVILPSLENDIFYAPKFEKRGVIVEYTNNHKKVFRFLKDLKNIFVKYNDRSILHVHVSDGHHSLVGLIGKFYGIDSVIFHSHNLNVEKTFKNLIIKVLFLSIGDIFLASSNDAAIAMFGPRILDNKNYFLCKNSIDVEKFRYTGEYRKKLQREYNTNGKTVLGFIGRLSPEKNIKFIIDIAYSLKNKNYMLLIIGDGPQNKELNKYIIDENIENVLLCGYQENTNEFLELFDIFLLPSFYESLGIVLIESQTNGLPTIASTNVPLESKVSQLINYIELEKENWIKSILSTKINPSRQYSFKYTIEKGYSKEDLLSFLNNLYSSQVKGD